MPVMVGFDFVRIFVSYPVSCGGSGELRDRAHPRSHFNFQCFFVF